MNSDTEAHIIDPDDRPYTLQILEILFERRREIEKLSFQIIHLDERVQGLGWNIEKLTKLIESSEGGD